MRVIIATVTDDVYDALAPLVDGIDRAIRADMPDLVARVDADALDRLAWGKLIAALTAPEMELQFVHPGGVTDLTRPNPE